MERNGHFEAPHPPNESKRAAAVANFLNLKQWEDRYILSHVARQIRKCIGPVGVSISLVNKTMVHVKFAYKLEYTKLPRAILIDSHTILTQFPLVISDTSQDWRTFANPLVTGLTRIRFYCGIPLISKDGRAIGALSVFDCSPNISITGKKVEALNAVSKEFMNLLEMPLATFQEQCSSRYSHLHSQVEIDLMKLTTKLGRATSKGGYMTIFERDGSGSSYSRNLNYEGYETITNKKIEKNVLPAHVSMKIRKELNKTATIREGFVTIAKSINYYHNLEFTCIIELRFIDKYRMPADDFPYNTHKINLADFPSRAKMEKKDEETKALVRTISSYGAKIDIDSADTEIWKKAFQSEFGLQLRNPKSDAQFNHALVMPFYRVKPNFVRDTTASSKENSCDVILRSGGYLLGVFNRSCDTFFNAGKISRLYDHVQLVHKVYMNK